MRLKGIPECFLSKVNRDPVSAHKSTIVPSIFTFKKSSTRSNGFAGRIQRNLRASSRECLTKKERLEKVRGLADERLTEFFEDFSKNTPCLFDSPLFSLQDKQWVF